MRRIKRYIKKAFCLHRWSNPSELHEYSRLYRYKYVCVECGQVAYRNNGATMLIGD